MSLVDTITTLDGITANRDPYKVLGKAMEELGEAAMLMNNPGKPWPETFEEECSDAMIAITDLAWLCYKRDNAKSGKKPEELRQSFGEYMEILRKKKLEEYATARSGKLKMHTGY